MFFKNISEIFPGREAAPLRILETRREGVSPWAGTDAQAVYAQQDTAEYGPSAGTDRDPPELDWVRTSGYVRPPGNRSGYFTASGT